MRLATTLIVLAAAGGFAASASAFTLNGTQIPAPRQETVHFGDLDPSTAQGAQALLARLKRATRDVCGQMGEPQFLMDGHAYHECRDVALKNAVAQLDIGEVTAMYKARPRHAAS